MTTRPVSWLGSSRDDVRAFPEDARARIGYELFRVQCGLTPTDWRPMAGIGRGVIEMRVHTGREYRALMRRRID